ncbi:MAG: cytochrome c biogenesis protein CcsA [Planctomycetota bacterium]
MMTRALFACLVALVGVTASAQPAGNAHPETRMVTSDAAADNLRHPFGRPVIRPTMTPTEKTAFAETVNLEPLRDLAVLHNGRVKIMDTLARETVEQLTGRSRYFDLGEPDEDGRRPKLHHDPLFTLTDLAIDPGHYVDKPLISIGYLPLRRAMLEAVFPDDPDEVSAWMRLTRVAPAMITAVGDEMWRRYEGQEAYRSALTRTDQRLNLFEQSIGNWMLVAPESADDVWHHLGEFPADSEIAAVTGRLGEAWRAGDAESTNAAIAELAALLPTINAEQYPTTRRSLEQAYNQANAFEWGFWLYALSLVALILAFGTQRRWLAATGITLLVTATVMHGVGFTLRCIVAERFAIQNQFESMIGLSFFASVVGLVIMIGKRQWLFGAATAGAGFLVLVTATQTDMPGQNIEREAAILNTSVLLKYHVTTVLVSYGLIALGFVISLFYLAAHYGAKLKGADAETVSLAAASVAPETGRIVGDQSSAGTNAAKPSPKPRSLARTLADLDTAHMAVLQLAFWTLGVGVLLGAWWADHSWGRWWAFDPKETWALVTWIIYLIVIHLRLTGIKNKALVTAWLSVVGFFVMLWTYFGVNLLLPGLHAYA